MGADALEFCEWLFARDEWGSLNVKICLAKWNRQGAPMDYARAEWEKERKGWMDEIFYDEIDLDLMENGPGEPPFIRLAKAEQSIRELMAMNGPINQANMDLRAKVAELEAALAEAREDAARWAYVRKHARDFRISARGKQRPRYSVHVSFTNYEYDTYDNIDAAIDAARVKP
jgi:hypothetical protein